MPWTEAMRALTVADALVDGWAIERLLAVEHDDEPYLEAEFYFEPAHSAVSNAIESSEDLLLRVEGTADSQRISNDSAQWVAANEDGTAVHLVSDASLLQECATALWNIYNAAPDRPTFLTVPGEIRNKIYELVDVREDSGIFLCSFPRRKPFGLFSEKNYRRGKLPSLLRTCKQIRQEASSILNSNFVQQNTFYVVTPNIQLGLAAACYFAKYDPNPVNWDRRINRGPPKVEISVTIPWRQFEPLPSNIFSTEDVLLWLQKHHNGEALRLNYFGGEEGSFDDQTGLIEAIITSSFEKAGNREVVWGDIAEDLCEHAIVLNQVMNQREC